MANLNKDLWERFPVAFQDTAILFYVLKDQWLKHQDKAKPLESVFYLELLSSKNSFVELALLDTVENDTNIWWHFFHKVTGDYPPELKPTCATKKLTQKEISLAWANHLKNGGYLFGGS